MRSDELILGVDGGGTKTVAWLAERSDDAEPAIVGRGTAGSTNPQAVGFDRALENLDRAVDAARRDAQASKGPFAAAVLALAGSDRDENRQAVSQWADDRRLAHRVRIVHDALPVLAAGTPDGWGVALIAGTGSLAFGQTPDGQTARAGGWGYLLGDEGSAFAIALAGLRAAMRAFDGRGPETQLVDGFLRQVKLDTPEQLVSAVHGSADPRATIASTANVVTQAAGESDEVARSILDQAGRALAAMVAAVANRLELSPHSLPLALGGGLLTGSPLLRDCLAVHLTGLGLQAEPVGLVLEPVQGAVKLASAVSPAW